MGRKITGGNCSLLLSLNESAVTTKKILLMGGVGAKQRETIEMLRARRLDLAVLCL